MRAIKAAQTILCTTHDQRRQKQTPFGARHDRDTPQPPQGCCSSDI